jgi:hypothetical protein
MIFAKLLDDKGNFVKPDELNKEGKKVAVCQLQQLIDEIEESE